MTYTQLINSTSPILVEFFATWCPHCRNMQPIVDQLKELLQGQVEVVQLDIDKNADAASEASAESVPTFLLYKGGQLLWRRSGEIDGELLLNKIQEALK